MSVSARVCCSRSCSAREGPAAGLMSRLVTARKERLTNSVMPKIAKRRSVIGRADSLRKGRMLDISDWSGEYNIELAGVLANSMLYSPDQSLMSSILPFLNESALPITLRLLAILGITLLVNRSL